LDEIDFAAEHVASFNAAALATVLNRLNGPKSTGVCRACNDKIEPERLRVNPKARHCSCCAEEEEHNARRAKLCGPR